MLLSLAIEPQESIGAIEPAGSVQIVADLDLHDVAALNTVDGVTAETRSASAPAAACLDPYASTRIRTECSRGDSGRQANHKRHDRESHQPTFPHFITPPPAVILQGRDRGRPCRGGNKLDIYYELAGQDWSH